MWKGSRVDHETAVVLAPSRGYLALASSVSLNGCISSRIRYLIAQPHIITITGVYAICNMDIFIPTQSQRLDVVAGRLERHEDPTMFRNCHFGS
jgi:hypothetical protein